MKIQTMTLPTGEFLLILSDVDPGSPFGREENAPLRRSLRDQTGAVGILTTTDEVEVSDAFTLEAHRRDEGRALLEEANLIDDLTPRLWDKRDAAGEWLPRDQQPLLANEIMNLETGKLEPTEEPWTPKVGDHVRATGPTWFSDRVVIGRTGVVMPTRWDNNPDGCVLVNFAGVEGNKFIAVANLEPGTVDTDDTRSED